MTCCVEVQFGLIFITNLVARVFVSHYCLDVVDYSHIIAVRIAVDVIVAVLTLGLVSLNELGLGLNPISPRTCPSRNCALFIADFNHAADNIANTEGNQAFSVWRYVSSFRLIVFVVNYGGTCAAEIDSSLMQGQRLSLYSLNLLGSIGLQAKWVHCLVKRQLLLCTLAISVDHAWLALSTKSDFGTL